jgi:hypothetical protein
MLLEIMRGVDRIEQALLRAKARIYIEIMIDVVSVVRVCVVLEDRGEPDGRAAEPRDVAEIGLTRWSRYSKAVTTPKFPPPPRTAQKRAVCTVALAVSKRPSAVTTSNRQ